MIASFVNDNHETYDKFLREFAYALRTEVHETTGKTPAELSLGRRVITPFQKSVMVTDGAEFVCGIIEKLFREARHDTRIQHEKWMKYYNRRKSEVNIKVTDLVLVQTHPLSSARKKIVAKFKPNFEGPCTVFSVQNNNVVIRKMGGRKTANVDQVQIYHQRKRDEGVVHVDSSVSSGLEYQSNSSELLVN
ncbi:uncharacterized protein TNCV_4951791 [Trichonephila clavipes]|nr:uncharacterized protein TNCV_4951791 [Trichonephila clavipes]